MIKWDRTIICEIGPLVDRCSLAKVIIATTGVEPKVLGKPQQEVIIEVL